MTHYTYTVTDRHLTSDLAYAEVRQQQISDAAAATIASWWQAFGNKALTALASGIPTDLAELVVEARRERTYGLWQNHRDQDARDLDRMALELLIGWAEQKHLEAAAKAGDLDELVQQQAAEMAEAAIGDGKQMGFLTGIAGWTRKDLLERLAKDPSDLLVDDLRRKLS